MTQRATFFAACLAIGLSNAASGGLVYVPYDDFNDNSIDPARWNILGGEVSEEDGRLHVWMNRNGHFFNANPSFASTEGKIGGHDILGFKLHSDRIPRPRQAGPGDSEAAVGISNGSDFIRIHWLNDVNEFIIRAQGIYGSGDIFRWDPDSPGPHEIPDGPLEIRDHGDNSIGVYHNHDLRYTFSGISIQPGSFFHALAYSNPSGGENGVPVDFDYAITVDDLQLLQLADDPPTAAVPEPSSITIFALGIATVLGLAYRRRHGRP
jgi:hypothetical protein